MKRLIALTPKLVIPTFITPRFIPKFIPQYTQARPYSFLEDDDDSFSDIKPRNFQRKVNGSDRNFQNVDSSKRPFYKVFKNDTQSTFPNNRRRNSFLDDDTNSSSFRDSSRRGNFKSSFPNKFRDKPTFNKSSDFIPEQIREEDLFKQSEDQHADVEKYANVPVKVLGKNAPPPMESFETSNLAKQLITNLKRAKFLNPTPIQKYAIPIALEKRDLMACAQTGSGKTAGYLFPIITGLINKERSERAPKALVLAPTRELALQIYNESRKFSYMTGLRTVVCFGGSSMTNQIMEISKGVDILVATPGRLIDLLNREQLTLKQVEFLVLDEADRMLDMGFEPSIREIVEQKGMPDSNNRVTMMYSATFPKEIQSLATDFLSEDYIFVAMGKIGGATELVKQNLIYLSDPVTEKNQKLMEILQQEYPKKTLIFVETKLQARLLELQLTENDFKAISIHGDKSQAQRDYAMRSFRTGDIPILVATDIASRGIDVKDIAHVINYDMPRDIESYIHRIGRTGRVGHKGLATSFVTDTSAGISRELIQVLRDSKQEIPQWLHDLHLNGRRNKNFNRTSLSRRNPRRNNFGEWKQWRTAEN